MSEQPSSQDIEELVAFLPRLQAEGSGGLEGWHCSSEDKGGVISISLSPNYSELVSEFFHIAARPCWTDYHYSPEEAGRMLEDQEAVRMASLLQIKSMLTYCVRGERFCQGHWAAMIREGHITRLLRRLAEIGTTRTD